MDNEFISATRAISDYAGHVTKEVGTDLFAQVMEIGLAKYMLMRGVAEMDPDRSLSLAKIAMDSGYITLSRE